MIRFKILGVKVNISFLYIALITLLSLYDNSGILILGVISSFFHEFAHFIAILILKIKPESLTFEVFGIKIKQPIIISPLKQFIVLISGVLGNLLLFLISLYTNNLNFATVNLCLAIFNLFPTYVLDGGQMLYLFLDNLLHRKLAYTVYKILSIIFSIIILLLGIKIMVEFKNPTIILTGIFLLITSIFDNID